MNGLDEWLSTFTRNEVSKKIKSSDGIACVIDDPRRTMSSSYLGIGLNESLKLLNVAIKEAAGCRMKSVCMMLVL